MPSSSFRSQTRAHCSYAPAMELPKMVGFTPNLITSVSRPATNNEHWTFYNFETHAARCDSCRDPYRVHRSKKRLCNTGHNLAHRVAECVYSKRDGREIYMSNAREEQLILVELPHGYDNVHSLLRAMERSLRYQRQAPIVTKGIVVPPPPQLSLDRTYYVAQRRPRGDNQETRRQPDIVDWPVASTRPVAQDRTNFPMRADDLVPKATTRGFTTEIRTPQPQRHHRLVFG